MNYFDSIKQNEDLKESGYEIPASFIFVLFYSFLIGPLIGHDASTNRLLIGTALFAIIYFMEVAVFASKAEVHVIPIVSFIESLRRDDLSIFLYRLPGQFVGAALAVLIIWTNIPSESRSIYSFQFIELDPFLTGLFTGFISQIIYLLYFFFMVHLKSISEFFRLIIFSIGLGIVFFIVTMLGKITLLNPFGFLFSSVLNGYPESLQTVLIGVVIHIIVPMFFISGTHFFVNGMVLKNKLN